MTDPTRPFVFDLLARQRDAVESRLRDLLAARGIDPDDRSTGWEDRARTALADLELHETVDWPEPYRAVITTTIRPRRQA